MMHSLFEVTAEDINKLNSEQIVELIARLAIATVTAADLPATYITWSSAYSAPDGGVDVAARLPIKGYVQASLPSIIGLPLGLETSETYFQVKKSNMRPADIRNEMRPKGRLRPIIEQLAKAGGTYVIVSSGSRATHKPLIDREKAMMDAVSDCADAERLNLEFYTSDKVATWVQQYPAVALWVLEQVGRSAEGWKSFRHWSDSSGAGPGKFLHDNEPRIKIGGVSGSMLSILDAVAKLRKLLSLPGTAVRMVGLSGVGKTRIAQAIFENGVGRAPLPVHYAIYTDSICTPTPNPVSLATMLIAQGSTAVIVVDNCNSALHAQLVPVVRLPASKISLLTIEYDVREDVPEGTTVMTVTPASDGLVRDLLCRSFPLHNHADRNAMVSAAGGNTRIALAIASAIGQTGHLGKLSDGHLFDRIFWQRNGTQDDNLMSVALAASLVFSFTFDDSSEDGPSSLPLVAALAGLNEWATHRELSKLEERQLLQSRGHWRALLPHALANYLAERALKQIPSKDVLTQLSRRGSPHLMRSFARRLAFFPSSNHARKICEQWLAPDGLLNTPTELDEYKFGTFEAAAIVAPAAALSALERCGKLSTDMPFNYEISNRLVRTLCEIAREATLFVPAANQLTHLIPAEYHRTRSSEAYNALLSFFDIQRCHTQAKPAVRLELLAKWLGSAEPILTQLGHDGLRRALGVSEEDLRFNPGWGTGTFNGADNVAWVRNVIHLALKHSTKNQHALDMVRDILAVTFDKLWATAELRENTAEVMIQAANGGFWETGWRAVEALCEAHNNQKTDDSALQTLLNRMAPTSLEDTVIAEVNRSKFYSFFSPKKDALFQQCEELGRRVADGNLHLMALVLPRIHTDFPHAERFGKSIGLTATDLNEAWLQLKAAWIASSPKPRHITVLDGFIKAAAERDKAIVECWLDNATAEDEICHIVPALSVQIGLTLHGVERIQAGISAGKITAEDLQCLHRANLLAPEVYQATAKLMVDLPTNPADALVVVKIVSHWIDSPQSHLRPAAVDLSAVCASVISRVQWLYIKPYDDYWLEKIAHLALRSTRGRECARSLGRELREQTIKLGRNGVVRPNFFKILLEHQIEAVFSGLFDDADFDAMQISFSIIREAIDNIENPLSLIPLRSMLLWCEQCKEQRYLIAASFVPLCHSNEDGSAILSIFSKSILLRSPNPLEILRILADRIWSSNIEWSYTSSAQASAAVLFQFASTLHDHRFQAESLKIKEQISELIANSFEREKIVQKNWEQKFE